MWGYEPLCPAGDYRWPSELNQNCADAKKRALRHIGCHMRGGCDWRRGKRLTARAAAMEWKLPSNEFLKYLKINCLWKSSTDSWYAGWMRAKLKVAPSLQFSVSQPLLYLAIIHSFIFSCLVPFYAHSMHARTVITRGFKQRSSLSFWLHYQLTTVGLESEQSPFSRLIIFIHKVLCMRIHSKGTTDGKVYF